MRSNKQIEGRHRVRPTFENENSDSEDDNTTQSLAASQHVRIHKTLTSSSSSASSSRPSRPINSSSPHLTLDWCTSSSELECNDTSDDEADDDLRFRDTSITGDSRIVYEKAKAELAYKVL